MTSEGVIFFSFVVVNIIFLIRIICIHFKFRGYIKRIHKKYYEKNIHLFIGGRSMPDMISGLDDPELNKMINKVYMTLRWLLICWAVAIFSLIIYFFVKS